MLTAQTEGDACEYCGGYLEWVDANEDDAHPGRVLACEDCEREAQNTFQYDKDGE